MVSSVRCVVVVVCVYREAMLKSNVRGKRKTFISRVELAQRASYYCMHGCEAVVGSLPALARAGEAWVAGERPPKTWSVRRITTHRFYPATATAEALGACRTVCDAISENLLWNRCIRSYLNTIPAAP